MPDPTLSARPVTRALRTDLARAIVDAQYNAGRHADERAALRLLARLSLTVAEAQLLTAEVLHREERGEKPWSPLVVAAILQSYRAYRAALAAPPVTDDPARCPVCALDLEKPMVCACLMPEKHRRDAEGKLLHRVLGAEIEEFCFKQQVCPGVPERPQYKFYDREGRPTGPSHYHALKQLVHRVGDDIWDEPLTLRELHFLRDGFIPAVPTDGATHPGDVRLYLLRLFQGWWATSAPCTSCPAEAQRSPTPAPPEAYSAHPAPPCGTVP